MSYRYLELKFAGRLIDLLGQQMYGGPVPSVAELIANAWDADADEVDVTLPANVHAEGATIVVRDYGKGMTFDELNEYYLHIGHERRVRGERTPGNRLVMGRKGIGKLAGFGIAEDIIVTSVKEGHLTELKLNYTELKSLTTVANHRLKPLRDEASTERDGVTVVFSGLKLSKNINQDSFRTSMSRRFALSIETMKVRVNGVEVRKEELSFEHREPATGWAKENVEGFGEIEYWFGFLKSTIHDPELRGVSCFARERVAQFTPFVFNLTGGINGQVALEYFTGQVKAEQLDEKIDLVATDRQTVNWQLGNAPILEEWGKEKVKQLCSEWKTRQDKRKVDRFQHKLGEFFVRIEKLSSSQERKDLTSALTKVAQIERMTEEDFRTIAGSMVAGVERESVRKVIQRINATSEDAMPELLEAIKEWDIIASVATAEILRGKIDIIEQFKKHIDARVPEKSKGDALDMQTFIKNYPWLLGHKFEQLTPADFHHERGVDKWIEEVLIDTNREYSATDERDGRRFDLVCIKNDWMIVVLELMRPGKPEDYDHIMRLNRYVTRIQAAVSERSNNNLFTGGKTVLGLLIADEGSSDTSLGQTKKDLRNSLDSITWNGLFDAAKVNYREYYDTLRLKAPDDPRLTGVVAL